MKTDEQAEKVLSPLLGPTVLVSAETPEDAVDVAKSFIDLMMSRDDGKDTYESADIAGAWEPNRDIAEITERAGTERYRQAVKDALTAEDTILADRWRKLRDCVLALAERDMPPLPGEAGYAEFENGIWHGYRLQKFLWHLDNRPEDMGFAASSDADLYDYRDDKGIDPLNETRDVYAVALWVK